MVDALFDEVQIQEYMTPEDDDVMDIPEEDSFVCPAQHGRPLQQKMGEEGLLLTQSQDDFLNVLGVVGLQDVDPVAEVLKEIGASSPIEREDMNDRFAAIVNDKSSYSRIMAARSVSPDRTGVFEGSLVRRALCPPLNSCPDTELSTSAYSPQIPISGSPTSIVSAELLSLDSKRVSGISGVVAEWPVTVSFHYSDGTSTTYATADFVEAANPIPAFQFRLHQSEHISAVSYKHTCAALNQRVLGSGIEFHTSFGRSFLLCGKPGPFFSWGSHADKTEWRVPPTHGIVGLCLRKEWGIDESPSQQLVQVLSHGSILSPPACPTHSCGAVHDARAAAAEGRGVEPEGARRRPRRRRGLARPVAGAGLRRRGETAGGADPGEGGGAQDAAARGGPGGDRLVSLRLEGGASERCGSEAGGEGESNGCALPSPCRCAETLRK